MLIAWTLQSIEWEISTSPATLQFETGMELNREVKDLPV